MRGNFVFGLGLFFFVVAGCGEPVVPPTVDSGFDGALAIDGGGSDGGDPTLCTVDDDCDDGLFCDGAEACMPGATDADDEGCVEASAGPCTADETCDESAGTCDAICPDADGDGHDDVACGGDDCDDADDERYPGNPEVCDMDAHDEDCNVESFGFLDADSDGSAAGICCNVLTDGSLRCGDDCNDGDATVNPRAGDGPPLFCDGVDNDCSGTSDEGCPCVEGETQECGTDPQLMRVGICRPGTQVCSGGTFTDTCIGATNAAEEVCDGLDNDCDGSPDEEVLRTYYPDVDTDGFGTTAGTPAMACSAPAGYASNSTDCDDGVASVNPAATEVCNGLDDNCYMGVDEGFLGTFYADVDGDGFGNPMTSMSACAPPTGYVRNATDCDDGNGSRNPATIEGCNAIDDNCNGMVDEGVLRTFYADADGDAWGIGGTTMQACTTPAGYAERSGDCDDARAGTNPAAPEVCNGIDDNCLGGTDEGLLRTFYRDTDRDSFGLDSMTMVACTVPSGYADRGGDCDDAAPGVSPGTAETCNGRDDNCDGTTDPGCTCIDATIRACGPTSDVGECSFGAQTCVGGTWGGCVGAVMSAAESCNGLDDDCDGMLDDGVTVTGCHRDGDGDNYGTGGATTQCRDAARATYGFCPVGWVNNAMDCNDGVMSIRPGATEVCDGVDQNCSGTADEGATIACYGDADADGYGTGSVVQRCADAARPTFGMCPSGFTNLAMDCNDGSSTVRPGATEVCNGIDDNCIGGVDESLLAMGCYLDNDGDAFGAGTAATLCRDASRSTFGFCPVNYTNVATDCNDTNANIRPTATESCNGLDDNCTGGIDEGMTAMPCYVDADGDGYGSGASSTRCRDGSRMSYGYCPVGYTGTAGDCNDGNPTVSPGDTEVCNGLDDNCAGGVDEGVTATGCYPDVDADNYGRMGATTTTQCRDAGRMANGYCPTGWDSDAMDCNDANAGVRPGAAEVCDGADNNCNAMVDEGVATSWYADMDSDGYGALTRTGPLTCTPGSGYLSTSGDCNDTSSDVRPGAPEVCNGIDDNCDANMSGIAIDEPGLAGPQCAGANPSAVHVGSWSCTAATCVPNCSGAWRDCDGVAANGCETDTRVDEANCGACGTSCGTGGVCASSACDTITDLVANGSNTCVLRSSGQLVCWGDGGAGQFCDPARTDENRPVLITAITAVDAIAIGDTPDGGSYVTMYARQANLLSAWGQNGAYEVGNGNAISPVVTPIAVLSANFGNFSGGVGHVCARTGAGSAPGVRCWGTNGFGELGEPLATAMFRSTPPTVAQVTGYIDVAAGDQYTCAIGSAGVAVRCWGRAGASGRLGDGTTTTIEVASPVNAMLPATFTMPTDVDVGIDHACALGTGTGSAANVVCWGRGTDGELGRNASTDSAVPVHVYATGAPLVYTAIAVGGRHTCGISGGAVYCWGDNTYGQLGSGTVGVDDDDPTPVTGLAGLTITDVALGSGHSCALTSLGDVYCWGRNASGQLGVGDNANRLTPARLTDL